MELPKTSGPSTEPPTKRHKFEIDPYLLDDAPKFAGAEEDLLQVWLSRIRLYFELMDLHQCQWVSHASLLLEGDAAETWFRAKERLKAEEKNPHDFEVFTAQMRADHLDMQLIKEWKIRQQLLSGFHQQGSVFEYYHALMRKICKLTTNPMAEADQLAIFVKGLKPKLRSLVLKQHLPCSEPFESVIHMRNLAFAYERALLGREDE